MIYYSIYIFSLLALMASYAFEFSKSRPYLVVLFALISLCLVCFRGMVGTDTANYLAIFSSIKNNGGYPGLEFGFVTLIKSLFFITSSGMAIMAIIAMIISYLLFVSSRASYRASLVLVLCVIPVFYLQMTMNGVRFGLAFALAMLAFKLIYEDRLKLAMIITCLSVSMHLSALMLFVVGAVLAENKKELSRWLMILAFALAAAGIVIFFKNSLLTANEFPITGSLPITKILPPADKWDLYLNFKSPSWYSGLSILSMSLLALYVIKPQSNNLVLPKTRQFSLLLVLVILSFALAKLSYAGLRIQGTMLFAIFLIMQFKPSFEGLIKSKKQLFLIGCLGILFFLNNAIQTKGVGESPFLPYSFNHEVFK
jgi:hypothetical protein